MVGAHLIPQSPPDIVGVQGKAWRADLVAVRSRFPNPNDCGVCGWVVYAPWAHPAWHSYTISLVHLRPASGVKPVVLYLPDATHEILLHALHPDYRPDLAEPQRHLTPPNFVGQFIAESDAVAAERIERDVRDICAGRLNPDTDALRQWTRRYGDHGLRPEYRVPKVIERRQ